MNVMTIDPTTDRYQRCIDASKRVRWDINVDVIRGRRLNVEEKFLPESLTLLGMADFLSTDDQLFLSQIQGRTYANIFGLVERFINAKVLELSQDHWLENQTALEAMIRFSDEELKHQELFRRVDGLCADVMPEGYQFDWNANEVAGLVLGKSTWAVLALTLHIELFTQVHYRESIDGDEAVSALYRDVFKFHWMEESQHALIDEMEFRRIDAALAPEERESAVDDFIELVGAVDGILNGQAKADADYFASVVERTVSADEATAIHQHLLGAYRWQYILSGAQHHHFQKVMAELLTDAQILRIQAALSTLQ
jgi:hypothetical protein